MDGDYPKMNLRRTGICVGNMVTRGGWQASFCGALALGGLILWGPIPAARAGCSDDEVCVLEPFVVEDSWTAADQAVVSEWEYTMDQMNQDLLEVDLSPYDFSDDSGGESGSAGSDSEEDQCGVNPFTVYDGNVTRRIDDLAVAKGAERLGLPWARYHNSIKRRGAEVFGLGGDWRHGWQYDLLEWPQRGAVQSLRLVYPNGSRRAFVADGKGGWRDEVGGGEQLTLTAGGCTVATPKGASLEFVRVPQTAGRNRYELRRIVGPSGRGIELSYDDTGKLVSIVDPDGRSLALSYVDVPYRKDAWARLGVLPAAGADGWCEIRLTPAQQAAGLRHFRIDAPAGAEPMAVAEIEAFAPGSQVPLRLTVSGEAEGPAAAADGNWATVVALEAGKANRLYVALGDGPVERVRVRAASGREATLAGVAIESLQLVPSSRRVLAEVLSSDGRSVAYEYATPAEALTGREAVVLSRVLYGDGTEAGYRYAWPYAYQRPMLMECDDPRYSHRAKRIRYAYQPGRQGMIHQEINPDTGGVYASLLLDPADPEKRTVHYSDLKTVSYRVSKAAGGRPTERVDGLGRKTRYEYLDNGRGRRSAVIAHDGRRKEFSYDERGRLAHVKHGDGREERLIWSVQGKLLERRESGRDGRKGRGIRGAERRTRHERDAHGRLVKTADAFGRVTAVERDAAGRVKRLRKPDGSVREYAHDAQGRLLRTTDSKGHAVALTRGQDGLVSAVTDATGRTVTLGRDKYGRVVEVVDVLGRSTRWERDERGQVTRIVNPDGTSRSIGYDQYGRKISETDELGRTTRLEYDGLSRVVSTTAPDGGVKRFDYTEIPGGCGTCTLVPNPSHILYPDGRTEERFYDSENRLLFRSLDADSAYVATTLFSYDEHDNVVTQTEPGGAVSTFTYDEDGHRLTATDALGNVTRFTYDEDGRRTSQTDPLGRTTRWTYDERGNVLTVTASDGGVTTNTYDLADRLLKTVDAAGGVTRFEYDTTGQLVAKTDATGATTRFEYDAAGRRTATLYSDGTRERLTYDAAGRLVRTESADGLITDLTLDAAGRTIATSDSLGCRTQTAYDAAGRRTAHTDALGRTTRWTYDERNNVTVLTRPDGSTLRKEYDRANRVIAETDAAGQTTRYTYTPAGDMASLTDANNHTYRFTYDRARRKTAMVYPDGSQETWAYDAAGRMVAYATRAGQVKTVAYNAAGQPVSETWTPNGCAANVTYVYDTAGKLVTLDNGQARLTYTYDARGRVASETSDLSVQLPGFVAHTVGYRYDAAGRKSGLVYPDGSTVRYGFDARGRLTEVGTGERGRGRSAAPLATYTFDAAGRIAELARDNGVATRYSYDMAGQLTDIVHAKSGETIAASHYELDGLGRRTAQTREDGFTERYGYDVTSQLTSVDYGIGPNAPAAAAGLPASATYAYDPLGNRTTVGYRDGVTGAPATETYATNALNQYTAITVQGTSPSGLVTTALEYDANGNLLFDGLRHYGYDAQNRLIAVESVSASSSASVPSVTQNPDPVVRAEFFYDARNRCVLRKFYEQGSQGQWVLTADSRALTYDTSWNLLAERTLDGRQAGEYIHGARVDEILLSEIANPSSRIVEAVYPLADGLGSTVALAAKQGRVTQRYRYDVYGRPELVAGEASGYRFLFTGREYLGSVGLNEHRNRDFSFALGRWGAQDPIGFAGGINLYAYSGNAPTVFVDPYGQMYDDDPAWWILQSCETGCKANKCGEERVQCLRDCYEEYIKNKRSPRPEPYEFTAFSAAWDWIRANPGKAVVGTVVIVGGTAFIIATWGTGSSIVLVAVAA